MHIFKSALYPSLWFYADAVKINSVEKLFCYRLNAVFPGKQVALLIWLSFKKILMKTSEFCKVWNFVKELVEQMHYFCSNP